MGLGNRNISGVTLGEKVFLVTLLFYIITKSMRAL